jgi:uracil-DNA glycosylase family 4
MCTLCSLSKTRKNVCWGETYSTVPTPTPNIWCIGKAPGYEEDATGRVHFGSSGQEVRHNLDVNGLTGRGVYLDNICKCVLPPKTNPTKEQVEICTENWLIPTLLTHTPSYIVTMGGISTRFFLGDVSMEMVHGIPRRVEFFGLSVVVIPTYHPAAGLHAPTTMLQYQCDMRVAADVIKGKVKPHPPVDEYPEPVYKIAQAGDIERIINSI